MKLKSLIKKPHCFLNMAQNGNYLKEVWTGGEYLGQNCKICDSEPITGGMWWCVKMFLEMNPWNHRISTSSYN